MIEGLKIKRVDQTDRTVLATLKKLHKKTFPYDAMYPWTPGYWWIAYLDSAPVGFCGYYPFEGNQLYLSRVGVLGSFGGRGIATTLLQRSLRQMLKQYTRVVTDTHRTNHASGNSLFKAGFRLYEPLDRWAFPDGLYWEKLSKK